VNQGSGAIALGQDSNANPVGTGPSVVIGQNSGKSSADRAIAIGSAAGETLQGIDAVAIENAAGNVNQGRSSIAIGYNSGTTDAADNTVNVGKNAGHYNAGIGCVNIGAFTGSQSTTAQGVLQTNIGFLTGGGVGAGGDNKIAIGYEANYNKVDNTDGIAIGSQSAWYQKREGIAIGKDTGNYQEIASIAIGSEAASASGLAANYQRPNCIAIGVGAGKDSQGGGGGGAGGGSSIAIGELAGADIQGVSSTAIGKQAGQTQQGINCIAIGTEAGQNNQAGAGAVAIGTGAGKSLQNYDSVAIGTGAGQSSQGAGAVAIGYQAGLTNQHPESVILNGSTTTALNSTGSGFYVSPIRVEEGLIQTAGEAVNVLYNPTTKELYQGGAITIRRSINVSTTTTIAAIPNMVPGTVVHCTAIVEGNVNWYAYATFVRFGGVTPTTIKYTGGNSSSNLNWTFSGASLNLQVNHLGGAAYNVRYCLKFDQD